MFRFLVVESTHLDLTRVAYLQLIILSVIDDISIDNEVFLMTDFINFKIKLI
jgi:hypothetical protein